MEEVIGFADKKIENKVKLWSFGKQELFCERAGIFEFIGKMPRNLAEKNALEELEDVTEKQLLLFDK